MRVRIGTGEVRASPKRPKVLRLRMPGARGKTGHSLTEKAHRHTLGIQRHYTNLRRTPKPVAPTEGEATALGRCEIPMKSAASGAIMNPRSRWFLLPFRERTRFSFCVPRPPCVCRRVKGTPACTQTTQQWTHSRGGIPWVVH